MTIVKNERIYGRALGLTIDGVDYWADVSKYELAPESKSDALTFADAANNSTPWVLKGTAIQSTTPTSLWSKVWENAGKTVDFILAPHGNKVATAEKPHFVGKVTIGKRPPIGSEAGEEKGAVFEFEWSVVGEPNKTSTSTNTGTGGMDSAAIPES